MSSIETPEEIEIIKAVENETYCPVEGQEKLKLETMLKDAAKKKHQKGYLNTKQLASAC